MSEPVKNQEPAEKTTPQHPQLTESDIRKADNVTSSISDEHTEGSGNHIHIKNPRDFKVYGHLGKEIPASRLRPHYVLPNIARTSLLQSDDDHRPTLEDTKK